MVTLHLGHEDSSSLLCKAHSSLQIDTRYLDYLTSFNSIIAKKGNLRSQDIFSNGRMFL